MMYYIISMLFACFYLHASEQHADKTNSLNTFKTIPIEYKREIKILFKNLFFDDVLSYSLLVERKINALSHKLQPFHEHDPYIIASINRVCFGADPKHHETIELRNKYDNLNRKINEIYSRDDWFEKTLIQLTSD